MKTNEETQNIWEYRLGKLMDSLQSIPQNAENYIALNYGLMFITENADQLKQELYKLHESWHKNLPFVGNEGVDAYWGERANSLREKCQEALEVISNGKYPRTNKNNAMEKENCADVMKTVVEELATEMENMATLLQVPHEVFTKTGEMNEMYANFYEQLLPNYPKTTLNGTKREYEKWINTYGDDIDLTALRHKENECWQKLKNSGFLDNFITDHCEAAQVDQELKRLFNYHFLKRKATLDKRQKLIAQTVGRYIYMNQLDTADWKRKVLSFLKYNYFVQRIDEEKRKLRQDQGDEQSPLRGKKAIVKQCIEQLMKEKDEKGELLMKHSNQWVAIHRILNDYCGFAKEPMAFYREMEELGMDEIRIPCGYDALKKSDGFFDKPFDEWDASKYNGSQKATFYKQYGVAARLKALLKKELES